MGAFFLRIIIYTTDLLTHARLRVATELPCLTLTSETVSGFFVHCLFILLACATTRHSI